MSVGMGEETVERAMGEFPRIDDPLTKLHEPCLIAINPLKALELLEMWKAKPDLPEILQPDQLT